MCYGVAIFRWLFISYVFEPSIILGLMVFQEIELGTFELEDCYPTKIIFFFSDDIVAPPDNGPTVRVLVPSKEFSFSIVLILLNILLN